MTLSRCKVTTRKTGKSLKISFQLSAICWWVFGWSYCSDLLFFSVKRQDIVLMRWVSPHVNQLDPTWSSKQLNQLDLVDSTCCDSRGLSDAVIGFLPDQLSNLLGPVRHALEKKNNFMPDPNFRQISHHAWGNNAADLFIASMESQSSLGMAVNIGLAWCSHTWYTWYLCYWEVTYQDLP